MAHGAKNLKCSLSHSILLYAFCIKFYAICLEKETMDQLQVISEHEPET
jgi:hypothetical protein